MTSCLIQNPPDRSAALAAIAKQVFEDPVGDIEHDPQLLHRGLVRILGATGVDHPTRCEAESLASCPARQQEIAPLDRHAISQADLRASGLRAA